MINRYDHAKKALLNGETGIDGQALLKTIHFLTESERVDTTIDNITKAYLSDPADYYQVKPLIEEP
ncbi:MAG: hypothetical protein IPJ06_14865 [Saprospiraceae bacterium]|nr:hypothetical protein [Saprospiraceae bacterium]